MSLNTLTLTIESPQVYTKQGVMISVTGIAQVSLHLWGSQSVGRGVGSVHWNVHGVLDVYV